MKKPDQQQMAVFEAIRTDELPRALNLLGFSSPLRSEMPSSGMFSAEAKRQITTDVFKRIMEVTPPVARHLTQEDRRFYAALACIYEVWGRTVARRFIPDPPASADKKMRIARDFWVAAVAARNLASMKSAAIERVRVLCLHDACSACRHDNNREYLIELAPVLPHERCECGWGCGCRLTAILDD